MSHEAKGLSPLAGGLGVPDAWYTAVVWYGPADAAASGRRSSSSEATAASRRMRFLMAPPPSDRTGNGGSSFQPGLAAVKQIAWTGARIGSRPLQRSQDRRVETLL